MYKCKYTCQTVTLGSSKNSTSLARLLEPTELVDLKRDLEDPPRDICENSTDELVYLMNLNVHTSPNGCVLSHGRLAAMRFDDLCTQFMLAALN